MVTRDDIIERLKQLGYTANESDYPAIDFELTEVINYTLNFCNIQEVPELVASFNGVCYPAHIDREANGIIAILGDIPPEPGFTCAELYDIERKKEYQDLYPITKDYTFISSSDAHNLASINSDINYFDIPDDFEHTVIDYIFDLITKGSK